MKLIRNKDISVEDWRSLNEKSLNSSPFQTWEFYQLYNSIPGYSADVFAVEESGNLKSLCLVTIQAEKGLKGYFSRRAIIYGGPVYAEYNEKLIKYLLNCILGEISGRVIYFEVRNYSDYSELKSIFFNAGWRWIPYLNIRLRLRDQSLKDIIMLMKYNRRREIKQSLKEGATYRSATDISEVEELFSMLKDLYKERVRLPLPGLDFFRNLYKSTIGKVFIVLHDNKMIGGVFCLYCENRSVYTLYYCAIREYNKRIFPAHLAILAAIDFGINNNLEYIDLVGAGLKEKKYGVRKYKQEFGGELMEYGRFRRVNNRCLFIIGKLGLWIMKHIK